MTSERGLGAIGLVVAMLIAALCYLAYLNMIPSTQTPKSTVAAVDQTRAFACRTNRQTVEREIQMWAVNHPGETASLAALEADGAHVASCPDGGEYALANGHVHCSKHQ